MEIRKVKEEIDKLGEAENIREYIRCLANMPMATMPVCGVGEFEEACQGKPILPLVDILSEHMSVIKTLYPSEYEKVLKRIMGIH